jgi:hypothetical protein
MTDGVAVVRMVIHFSARHEDILITVCLSNYDTVCNVRLTGKGTHGKQVMCYLYLTKDALWANGFNS